MRMTVLASIAAVALAATVGSVSAADRLATLNGVNAVPMSSSELGAVKGMDHHFTVNGVPHVTDQHQDAIGVGGKGKNFVLITFSDGVERLVAPSYRGLMKACGNGTIDGPGFLC